MPALRPHPHLALLLALGLVLGFGSTAEATLIEGTATYVNDDDASLEVLVTAQFDNAGITGVGQELFQVTSLVFLFDVFGQTQAPVSIVLGPSPWPDGTFVAQYTDGVFDAVVTWAPGGSGFARPPAQVTPTRVNNVKQYIDMGVDGNRIARVNELFEFSGSVSTYLLDLDDTPWALSVVPEPSTAALLLLGLGGLLRPGRSAAS